jgi:hypothetical protein
MVHLNAQSQNSPFNSEKIAPKTINQLNKTEIKIPDQRTIPCIDKSDRVNSKQENNTALGGPINTKQFERSASRSLSRASYRRAWVDIENAMAEFMQSSDQRSAALQALNSKTLQCFPAGQSLSMIQQRQARCSRSDTEEQCFRQYMGRCTRREKATNYSVLTLLYQDGNRVRGILDRYNEFR